MQAGLAAEGRPHRLCRVLASAALCGLLALLLVRAAGTCMDFAAAIGSPLQIDYGEGIVWQQAALIPGPRMYSSSTALPFIVFHYPPLYHLLSRAALAFEPDMLAAGRLVSALSTLLAVPAVAGLVLLGVKRPGGRATGVELCCAAAAGLLPLGLHAVHVWGMVMRVDMLALALSLWALLAGIRAGGRFAGTALALLLALAAVFAKQTYLPAGIAVFAVAVVQRPRSALAAGALAGTVGLCLLGAMQALTGGGFLQNIVGYNINRFEWANALLVLFPERHGLPLILYMLGASVIVLLALVRTSKGARGQGILARCVHGIRQDRTAAARWTLLLYLLLSGLTLGAAFKTGGGFNYLLPCLAAGCAVIGIHLSDLAADGRRLLAGVAAVLLGALLLPAHPIPLDASPERLAEQEAVVRRIAGAEKPVASENMALLMLAGKPVIFEPAIVTELAAVGRWDEALLVQMIRSGGFAFMITTDNLPGAGGSRSAAVDAALRAAYPRVERVNDRLWINLPKEGGG